MGRQELHSDSVKIEQRAPIGPDVDLKDRDPEIVQADASLNHQQYLDELAFGEEPVTIRIEPSADKNAAGAFPAWVNGKGAEVLSRGRWIEITYLPVGQVLTVKRKYLAVLASAKYDAIETLVQDKSTENNVRVNNTVQRFTSAVMSFSVIEDANPRGAAWLTELRRRNL